MYQVNPGSAKEEIGETMLGFYETQAALITPDRLLELIDQFGLVENRMKWAPNKKLPFEIALIKAVQTLGQTTLTEVIDALTALREGDPAAAPMGRSGSGAGPAPAAADRRAGRTENSPVGAGTGAPSGVGRPSGFDWGVVKKAVAKTADPAPTPAPAAVKPAPAIIPKASSPEAAAAKTPVAPPPTPPAAEPEPARPSAVREEPAPAAAPAADFAAAPAASAGALDGPKIWRELVSELRAQRPLITAWVQSGKLLSIDNDTFLVGFPTTQRMIHESLSKPTNRKLLESLLTKLAGRPIALKMELRDEDALDQAPAVESGGGSRVGGSDDDDREHAYSDEDAPSSSANGHSQTNGARKTGAEPPVAAATASDDPAEAFKNDPLIQKALRIFEGEIRSVDGPGDAT